MEKIHNDVQNLKIDLCTDELISDVKGLRERRYIPVYWFTTGYPSLPFTAHVRGHRTGREDKREKGDLSASGRPTPVRLLP